VRFYPLILLFLLVYIEVSLFIWVAGYLGVALSLLLIVATSCLGISLVRHQGLKTLFQIQQKLASGENPAGEMVKSVSLLFAGFLLLIPGFFTDILGLLLMFPPLQKLLTLRLMPIVSVYQPRQAASYGNTYEHEQPPSAKTGGNIIDGEFKRKDEE
jgi:UPF0716 protein FxsA